MVLTDIPQRLAARRWLPTVAVWMFLSSDILCQPLALAQQSAQTDQFQAQVESVQVRFSDVRDALQDLDADQLQTRDEAEKKLIAMGPAVLGFLPEVTPRTSGELKVRLQRIRQTLQKSEIAEYFSASTVSLNGEMKVTDALEQIGRQTGNRIRLQNPDPLTDRSVSMEVQDGPFWDVMRELMTQAKLRLSPFGTTENELVLIPSSESAQEAPAVFSSGPFRVDMLSVRSTLTFNSNLPGQLDLSLLVTWEPRVEPVFMQLPMASLAARTAAGHSLTAVNTQASPEIPLNLGGATAQIDLQLTRPPREAKVLESLSGEFVMAVPSDRHQYAFENFGNGVRKTEKFGDVTVTLEGARRNGAVYEMPLFVEFGDAQGALDSFRGWILSNEAYLLDARNTRLEHLGMNTYAIRPNAVGIAYRFQINDDPNTYKLIYESPASISRQTVKYELRDIPLP